MTKKMNELSTTITVLDNGFFESIEKNYLNEAFWEKEWLIYRDEDFAFYVSLSSLKFENKELELYVKIKILNEELKETLGYSSDYWWADYYIKRANSKTTAKKSIYNRIKQLLISADKSLLRTTDEYNHLLGLYSEAQKRAVEEAEDFLDENNIYNNVVREAYIDYVSENFENPYNTSDFIEKRQGYNFVETRSNLAYLFNDKDDIKHLSQLNNKSEENFEEFVETLANEDEVREHIENILEQAGGQVDVD